MCGCIAGVSSANDYYEGNVIRHQRPRENAPRSTATSAASACVAATWYIMQRSSSAPSAMPRARVAPGAAYQSHSPLIMEMARSVPTVPAKRRDVLAVRCRSPRHGTPSRSYFRLRRHVNSALVACRAVPAVTYAARPLPRMPSRWQMGNIVAASVSPMLCWMTPRSRQSMPRPSDIW